MKRFAAVVDGYVIDGYSLVKAEQTSFYRGGGVLRRMYMPGDVESLIALMNALEGNAYVIGNGSNLLIDDGEVSRDAVCLRRLKGLSFQDNQALAQAGCSLEALLFAARGVALGGLEFLHLIPASVGGAVKKNAGALGKSIGERVAWCDVLRFDKGRNKFLAERVKPHFSYRKSDVDGIVLSVALSLDESTQDDVDEGLRKAALRRSNQPLEPSLGCVFKNPTDCDYSAGYLLEGVGMKGEVSGGAAVSEKHANFIVNVGGGTARDYLDLVEMGERRVYEQYGTKLQREFDFLHD